jgi:antitoxin component of MazEF toxin-antitoxin module
MTELAFQITDGGLDIHVPAEALKELGWQPGQQVAVQVLDGRLSVAPAVELLEVVQRRALAYLDRKIGDAVTTGKPVSRPDGWRVPVYLSYADRLVGELAFTSAGELDLASSTPREEMLCAANAA